MIEPGLRVLVVDDSVVIRRLVSGILEEADEVAAVDVASDGRVALARIERDEPDLVILDVDMPGMNGLQVLARIRARHPRVRVIMFSVLTERGAETTLDALSLGALDYTLKPSASDEATTVVRDDLLSKIRAIALRRPFEDPVYTRDAGGPPEVVVVAASTGGPDAVAHLLAPLSETFPLPIVVVQHMPAAFTGPLARRLDRATALPVAEARQGAPLAPGRVWVAPGGFQTSLERDGGSVVIALQDGYGPGCRPSADICFASAAAAFGEHVWGVVLTGMGRDGLRGSAAIVDAGGTVIAQDDASSVVWGMPRHVVEAGLAHEVNEPAVLAAALLAAASAEVSS